MTASYNYEIVTAQLRYQIESVHDQVRAYLKQGQYDQAAQLAHTLHGALRLWDKITHHDQPTGDALRLEQSIEKVVKEAAP